MKRLALLVSLAVAASVMAVPAMALNVVNASAPQVNYVFSTDGTVTVTDMTSAVYSGGFLQSRIFQGEPGSPAAGKWVYEYRLDLTCAQTALSVPNVTAVGMSTGPVRSYDYDFNGFATDQVYVITSGGMGWIGLSSASGLYGYNQFHFSSPVYPSGGGGCGGDSTYFWGYTSDYAPHVVTATIYTSTGNLSASVYAPNW
jgi:hypothetical protein